MGDPQQPRTSLAPGSRLGHYDIGSMLGEGGMGVVYSATDAVSGAAVALKVLKPALSGEEFRRRFAHEARAASAVEHRHLVRVLETGEDGDRLYLAMEYIDGISLERRIKSARLELRDAASILVDTAAGLDALHAAGILHRDVKTSNVLIDANGRASLTDFGLARGEDYTVLTRTGQLLGSVAYMAPELIRGAPASRASDIYAFGCMAYACVAGTPPFRGRSVFQLGLAHLNEAPADLTKVRDDVSPEVSSAILQALAKEPERRPRTAMAYAQVLRHAIAALQ